MAIITNGQPDIFDRRKYLAVAVTTYRCFVPKIYLISAEEIKHKGYLTSGNPAIDLMSDSMPIEKDLTIFQMVEIYHRGYMPVFANQSIDALKVYRAACDYVKEYLDVKNRYPNAPTPPVEDLRAIDEFAGEVYILARNYEKEEVKEEHGFLAAMRRRAKSRTDFEKETKRDENGKVIPVAVEKVAKQHESPFQGAGSIHDMSFNVMNVARKFNNGE